MCLGAGGPFLKAFQSEITRLTAPLKGEPGEDEPGEDEPRGGWALTGQHMGHRGCCAHTSMLSDMSSQWLNIFSVPARLRHCIGQLSAQPEKDALCPSFSEKPEAQEMTCQRHRGKDRWYSDSKPVLSEPPAYFSLSLPSTTSLIDLISNLSVKLKRISVPGNRKAFSIRRCDMSMLLSGTI